METITAVILAHPKSLSLLGMAIIIRLWVNRRRFYRRGLGGLQQFSSYRKSVIVTLLERMAMGLSVVLIIAALILFISAH